MTNYFEVWSDVDPRDLRINKKFRNSPHLPPGVSRAMDHLIVDIKMALPDDFTPQGADWVEMIFVFPDRRTDVDGPIKRTLDAIEKAIKAKGHTWHDGKVNELHVKKKKAGEDIEYPKAGIFISMM